MILEFVKTSDFKLVPCNEDTINKVLKMKTGEIVTVEYKPKRNYQFHKKAYALLNIVFKNQDKYTNLEDLRTEFKLKAGWYQEHITTKGKIMYIPKSMSFAEMDAEEFEDIYNKFIDIALKHFVGFSKEELENEILRFI